MDVTTIIENFGFPIGISIVCIYGLVKMYNNMVSENAKREERNYTMLEKFSISIEKFTDVLEGYEKKLSVIENDVKEIKVIVNK